MRPFIHIAGLFRSGTTLVQELLTEKAKSFIFHEARFGDGWWQFEEHDRRYLRTWGWYLPKFNTIAETWAWFMEDNEDGKGIQIGVKEIRNQNANFYHDSWQGNARLVVVDRDPFDIYVSCHKMFMRSNADFKWAPHYLPLTAVNLFRECRDEIRNINRLWDDYYHPLCKRVFQYAALCTGDSNGLYGFCESDVKHPDIGGYHNVLKRGKYETEKHKGQITRESLSYETADLPSNVELEALKFRKLVNEEKSWQ